MLTPETIELASGRRQVVYRGGEGPPIVWLHAADGIGESHPLLAALAGSHSIVAPLAPGFAEGDELGYVADVHELAMHYDDVFRALDIEGATVIGHSFGAMVGAELAAHYPERVAQLVLIAPVGLWNDDYPVADVFAVPLPLLPQLLFADPPPPPDPAAEPDPDEIIPLVRGMSTVASFLFPIPDLGLSRRLYRITARTLVVFGEQDALVPARYADDFVSGIADASKVIVPGAGHMVPVERTDEVLAAIEGFLAPVAA
jgi:pimeloyl-ACP methyl ester carboxylesterase